MLNHVWPRLLSAFREERGLTQERAAEALNATAQTLRRWETGKSAPNPGQWTDIAAGMGYSSEGLGLAFARELTAVCTPEGSEAAASGEADESPGVVEAPEAAAAAAPESGLAAVQRRRAYSEVTSQLAGALGHIATMGTDLVDARRDLDGATEVFNHLQEAHAAAVKAHLALGRLEGFLDEPDDEE